MKYKEVYLALNQRKLDAPGFHYSDYSGWRAANQSYMTRQRPLWIVAEDPAAGRRMWICHDGSALSVTICKMNSEGHSYGHSHTADSVLEYLSMVFQNVYLFHDSVENNIRFGRPEATHEQVVEAAKRACCHDFILSLPDGYDTIIGEGGSTLSGGEKQRISIARAILKDAPIIILDEATSSVDPENEQALLSAIQELTKDKTLISIAHRLSTVRNADQIVVIDQGRIVQQGKHTDLLQKDGIYRKFLSLRTRATGWRL